MSYDKSYFEHNGQEGDRLALAMYARIFQRYISEGRVLEFGAGKGHLSKRLARNFTSFAYDISPYAREAIRQISPTTMVPETLDEVPAQSLDGIISLHTLEHIAEPLETLRFFARVLKPGGLLFFVVPNKSGLGFRLKKERWFAYRDKTHVSLLPAAVWRGLAEKAGFKVLRTSSDGFWDVPYLPIVPRFLQKLLFFPPSALMVLLGRLILPHWFGEDLILVARL